MEPGPFDGGEERLELLFSWFDADAGGPIEDDLDEFLADRLSAPGRRRRSRLSWRARRARPSTA
jgi:hypothetical protein